MARIIIEVDRAVLPKHTEAQFEEWARYMLTPFGAGQEECLVLDKANPLFDCDLTPWDLQFRF